MNCLHWLGLGLSLATASYAQVIVNAGAFEESRPVAPNSLAVAFGEFAEATPATANTLPLPVPSWRRGGPGGRRAGWDLFRFEDAGQLRDSGGSSRTAICQAISGSDPH